jgi:hypothetical protein
MMRASDVRRLIASRYAAPTHSTFFEVADATGARHSGWADAITMSLWPSHGLHIEGFEIKVSKYDWQREIAKPLKAERFAARCDKWWIVASDGVIDDVSEIPENWGYMLATPEKLTIVRQATINPATLPLDKFFLASILRSADKASDTAFNEAIDVKIKILRESDETRILEEVRRRIKDNDQSLRILEEVHARLKPEGWGWLNETGIVDAIVAVYKSGISETYGGLKGALKACEDAAEKMREAYVDLGLEIPPRKVEKKSRKKRNG